MSSELEVLFSSAARVEILRLFLLNPDRRFYQREVERETGQPIRAVQREVERLEGIELLRRSEEGNRVYYRLNGGFPLLAGLKALFQEGAGHGRVAEAGSAPAIPAEPSTIDQPFAWMETPPLPPLPAALRRAQVEGEWDQAY